MNKNEMVTKIVFKPKLKKCHVIT